MDYSVLLLVLLALEILARVCLEVRERRATQLRGGLFAVLRMIPLINDIVPLPEGSSNCTGSAALGAEFVEEHEKAHKALHHGILRNLLKVILLSLAVGLLLLSYVAPRDCAFRTTKASVTYILVVSFVTIFFAVPSGGEFIYFQF